MAEDSGKDGEEADAEEEEDTAAGGSAGDTVADQVAEITPDGQVWTQVCPYYKCLFVSLRCNREIYELSVCVYPSICPAI